jgi:uncharacterized protein
MSKILFWVVVILVALLVMRLLARHSVASKSRAQPPGRKGPRRFEAMVQCAHCGVHLPAGEAVHVNGNTWCSHEHARLGKR